MKSRLDAKIIDKRIRKAGRKAAIERANREVGKLIKFYRQRQGLTQKAMAEKLGVHWVTLYRWEHGKGTLRMSVDDFLKMLEILGADADMLIGGIKL